MPGWAIVDLARDRVTVVFTAQRGYFDIPLDPARFPGLTVPPGTTMTRIGTATVAGLGCTDWQVQGVQEQGTACITGDGLVLRAKGRGKGPDFHGSGSLHAVQVHYGPQPAGLFVPPAGFRRIDLPHIGAGPAAPRRP